MRAPLRGVGVGGQGEQARGSALAVCLLFDARYTQELKALGEADTDARRDELLRLFGQDRLVVVRKREAGDKPDLLLP